MSNLVDYARGELDRIGSDDDMQKEMNADILKIVKDFSEQGHSGFSAAYAIGALTRLLAFLPLTPLTGEPDEWNEVSHDSCQNKRCSRVFKDTDGVAYDIEALVVSHDDGKTWEYPKKWEPISFPYTPPVSPRKIKLSKAKHDESKELSKKSE